MSTVGTSAALGSLVDLDVLDNEVAGVEALGVGVGLGVLQKVEEELGGLNRPTGTGNTPLLSWNTVSIIPSQTPFSDLMPSKSAMVHHAMNSLPLIE